MPKVKTKPLGNLLAPFIARIESNELGMINLFDGMTGSLSGCAHEMMRLPEVDTRVRH